MVSSSMFVNSWSYIGSGVCIAMLIRFCAMSVYICRDLMVIGDRLNDLLLLAKSLANSLALMSGLGCLGGWASRVYFFNKIPSFTTIFFNNNIFGEIFPSFSFSLFVYIY